MPTELQFDRFIWKGVIYQIKQEMTSVNLGKQNEKAKIRFNSAISSVRIRLKPTTYGRSPDVYLCYGDGLVGNVFAC